jgi:hypothetical protein|eukprot:4733547-Prymnesium_polylepis.1
MISSFGWAAIGVVNDKYDLYASAYANQIRTHGPSHGVAVIISTTFIELRPETQAVAVGALAASRVNVIVAIVIDQDAPSFFEAADEAKLLRSGYTWIVADTI